MPEIARGNGADSVLTGHGCDSTTVTDECSPDVIVEGNGVVREGDKVLVHLVDSGADCVPHAPTLDTAFSTKVIINGKGAAYKGSKYGGTHSINTGSSKVIIS